MATEIREPREDKILYSRITPLSSELKQKLNIAFQDVINRIKDKHLS